LELLTNISTIVVTSVVILRAITEFKIGHYGQPVRLDEYWGSGSRCNAHDQFSFLHRSSFTTVIYETTKAIISILICISAVFPLLESKTSSQTFSFGFFGLIYLTYFAHLSFLKLHYALRSEGMYHLAYLCK